MNLEITTLAQKNYSLILKHLTSTGQTKVADALGLHKSSISRMKDGDMERFAKILALINLTVVSTQERAQADAISVLEKAKIDSLTGTDLFKSL